MPFESMTDDAKSEVFTPARITLDRHRNITMEKFYAAVQLRMLSLNSVRLNLGDLSETTLTLTREMISMNNSSYTAWALRRKCLEEQDDTGILQEVGFVDDWCEKSPKNYQVWFHRRWLVEALLHRGLKSIPDLISSECSALKRLIDTEPKHYHGWGHRMYIANLFSLFESHSELEFSIRYISQDVRNNSAWNHRRRAIRNHPYLLNDEIGFAVSQISLCLGNESAWVYLRSLEGWHKHEKVIKFFASSLIYEQGTYLLYRHAIESFAMCLNLDGKSEKGLELIQQLRKQDKNRENVLALRLFRNLSTT